MQVTAVRSFEVLIAAVVSSAFEKAALPPFESDRYLVMLCYLFDHSSVADVAGATVSVLVVRAAEQLAIQLVVYSD